MLDIFCARSIYNFKRRIRVQFVIFSLIVVFLHVFQSDQIKNKMALDNNCERVEYTLCVFFLCDVMYIILCRF